MMLTLSCQTDGPKPITLNSDACDNCKMTIVDGKFGAEVITKKGRAYKFDDILCMRNYVEANDMSKMKSFYVHDYTKDNVLIPATSAHYLKGGNIHSPMNGNIAAFTSAAAAKEFESKLKANSTTWDAVMKK